MNENSALLVEEKKEKDMIGPLIIGLLFVLYLIGMWLLAGLYDNGELTIKGVKTSSWVYYATVIIWTVFWTYGLIRKLM